MGGPSPASSPRSVTPSPLDRERARATPGCSGGDPERRRAARAEGLARGLVGRSLGGEPDLGALGDRVSALVAGDGGHAGRMTGPPDVPRCGVMARWTMARPGTGRSPSARWGTPVPPGARGRPGRRDRGRVGGGRSAPRARRVGEPRGRRAGAGRVPARPGRASGGRWSPRRSSIEMPPSLEDRVLVARVAPQAAGDPADPRERRAPRAGPGGGGGARHGAHPGRGGGDRG